MGLGGAALGALANPEDRKKGALMGLGAGLLAPVAAPMMGLAGAPAVTAVTPTAVAAAAPTAVAGASTAGANAAMLGGGTFAPIGAQAGLAVQGAAPVVTGGVQQAIVPSMMDKVGMAAANTYEAGMTKAGEALTSDTAKTIATQGAIGLMKPQPKAQIQQGPSLALTGSGQEQVSPYQRAALNRQQRMKQAGGGGPRRFI